MAVNILSLGTFLLLDVSLTFGEADTSVLATHQVLIQIHNKVYAMCSLDSLQQQISPSFSQGQAAITFTENVLKENQ